MKKIFINDEHEKNKIITSLDSVVYNSSLSKLERRNLRRNAAFFIIENRKLKLRASDINKYSFLQRVHPLKNFEM